jgi:single-strand DNA-binding protein
MSQLCEVIQIGRVGKIKPVGPNLLISVASDASYKKDGDWVDRANWIEHTIFASREGLMTWASDNLSPGDLVFVRSTPSQSSYKKEGQTVYGYTFAVADLRRETAKPTPVPAKEEAKAKAKPKTRGRLAEAVGAAQVDDDIPF